VRKVSDNGGCKAKHHAAARNYKSARKLIKTMASKSQTKVNTILEQYLG